MGEEHITSLCNSDFDVICEVPSHPMQSQYITVNM